MIAVDTNVLIYARHHNFPQHEVAVRALTRLAESDTPWGIPVFCAVEFVRVVTHRRVFDPPSSPEDAVEFVNTLLESPTARLLLPNARFWSALAGLLQRHNVTRNDVFDAAIAACCSSCGAREILTEDRDFQRFTGLRTLTLAEFVG